MVLGIFKKIKTAAQKVGSAIKNTAKKIGKGVKNVAQKVVNTGAKVVKKWANVNEKVSNVVNKIVPGTGLIGGGLKVASKLYGKIYEKIGDGAEKIIKKTNKPSITISQPTQEQNPSQIPKRPLKGPVGPNYGHPINMYNEKIPHMRRQTYERQMVNLQESRPMRRPQYGPPRNMYNERGPMRRPQRNVTINNYYGQRQTQTQSEPKAFTIY